MQKSIEKILVDIIQTCLNLPVNYGKTSKGDVIPSVIIYSQNIKLFNTEKMQITIRTVSSRVYSNRNEFVTNSDGTYSEIQDLNIQKVIQIDCYSRNNDARDRNWEITAALNSVYAQQKAEEYNFKIGTITSSQNLSGIDGGSVINRFSTTFSVLVHEQKITQIEYYDKFGLAVYTEQGQIADINNYQEQD